jgi:hypothetical protein
LNEKAYENVPARVYEVSEIFKSGKTEYQVKEKHVNKQGVTLIYATTEVIEEVEVVTNA